MKRESSFSAPRCIASTSTRDIKSDKSQSSFRCSSPTSITRDEGIYIPDIDTPKREERGALNSPGTESSSIPFPERTLPTTTKARGGRNFVKLKPRSRKFHDPVESVSPTSKKLRSSSDDPSGSKRANMCLSSSPLYASDIETELIFQSFVTYIDERKDGSDAEDGGDDSNGGETLPASSPTTTIPNIQNHTNFISLTKPRPIRRPINPANELMHSPKTTGSNATLPTSICSAFAVTS